MLPTVVADLAAVGGPVAHISDASETLPGLLAELLPLIQPHGSSEADPRSFALEHGGTAATTEDGWRQCVNVWTEGRVLRSHAALLQSLGEIGEFLNGGSWQEAELVLTVQGLWELALSPENVNSGAFVSERGSAVDPLLRDPLLGAGEQFVARSEQVQVAVFGAVWALASRSATRRLLVEGGAVERLVRLIKSSPRVFADSPPEYCRMMLGALAALLATPEGSEPACSTRMRAEG